MKTAFQPRAAVTDRTDIWKRVANHPFFAGMSTHHIEILSRYATAKEFTRGEIIFHAGQPANGFYLIESGAVGLEGSVLEHGPITTDVVHAGEPLGWSRLFPPYLWHFDARAIEPTKAIFLDKTKLRRHYSEDLTLGNELFERMSQVMVRRLQSARRKLIEAVKKSNAHPNRDPIVRRSKFVLGRTDVSGQARSLKRARNESHR